MHLLAPRTYRLLLLALLPLSGHAAPPPYWPGYPPPPYYYPPPPKATGSEPSRPPAARPTASADSTSALTANPAATETHTVHIAPTPSGQPASSGAPLAAGDTPEKARENESDIEPDEDSALSSEIASAIQQGNFAEAYYLWRPLAEAGNADAQYGIGWMYHNGYGLAIDDEEAIAWWELASRQGHVDATYALGMLYSLGEGELRRDMVKAVSYYHQAALAGHEDARLLLRTLMAEGNAEARKLMHTLLGSDRVGEITPPASVSSSKANLRKGPGTHSKVVATLQQGTPLMPLRRKERWLLVGVKGEEYTGWIYDTLVGRDVLLEP